MIFLTVGSHEPFDRLVRGVDAWCAARGTGDQVFGQITDRAAYKPRNFRWEPVLTPPEFTRILAEASCIVSHAGMGTIINALSSGKPIAVMARRGHLNETRNDHQFATVQRLGSRAGLLIAETENDLPDTLDALLEARSTDRLIPPYVEEGLSDVLRDFIHHRDT